MVGGKCAVVIGKGKGCVDFTAVAGRYADFFRRRGIVRAISDLDGDCGASYEAEGRYIKVLYACGIIC